MAERPGELRLVQGGFHWNVWCGSELGIPHRNRQSFKEHSGSLRRGFPRGDNALMWVGHARRQNIHRMPAIEWSVMQAMSKRFEKGKGGGRLLCGWDGSAPATRKWKPEANPSPGVVGELPRRQSVPRSDSRKAQLACDSFHPPRRRSVTSLENWPRLKQGGKGDGNPSASNPATGDRKAGVQSLAAAEFRPVLGSPHILALDFIPSVAGSGKKSLANTGATAYR
jgi:hypothetical protein